MRTHWTFSYVSVLSIAVGSAAIYGDTISTWSAGITTNINWSTPGNWTPPGVPDNSAGTKYDVTLAPGGTVEPLVRLDISPTINSLTLGSGTFLGAPTSGKEPVLTVKDGATLSGFSTLFVPLPPNPFPRSRAARASCPSDGT
jgi:hypothetical protein